MFSKSIFCAFLSFFSVHCWAASVAVIDLAYVNTSGVFVQTSKHTDQNMKMFEYVKDLLSKDKTDHGNAMANIIASINPSVEIVKVRIDNSMDGLIDAIEFLNRLPAEKRPKVVNMSIVSLSPCSTRLQQQIDQGIQQGTRFVAAMGNEGGDRPLTPASCEGVNAVGTYRHNSTVPADFSNRSDKGIYIDIDQSALVPNWQKTFVGTSYSAAVVSGLLSLDTSNPVSVSSQDISAKIRQYQAPTPTKSAPSMSKSVVKK